MQNKRVFEALGNSDSTAKEEFLANRSDRLDTDSWFETSSRVGASIA
jgi:hypothetical protein